ncbi:probable zinc transporter protein DDB_G0282067 isoform X3 [Bacillus rossius redtenbacheri]|uniref:probable zinc transporter protein DDB_G0282067 isoform X2 n=1 Tax=Bacillus rossius redtenbacheri TaxID=93214 RepID=UPI002FDC82D2
MKTAAITLLSALLVVSLHEAFGSFLGRHELRKRDADCSVRPEIGDRHVMERCCSKAVGLIESGEDERGPHHGEHEGHEEHGHEGHGPPGEHGHEGHGHEGNVIEEHGHEGHGPPGEHRHEGHGHEGHGHHGSSEDSSEEVAHGPSGHGDREERARCIVEELMQNASLMTDGRLNGGALVDRIVDLLTHNATAWTHDKIQEIVSHCVATSAQRLVGVNTNCSSGALEWTRCLHRQMIVECPDEYWEHSDQCNSLNACCSR